MQRSASDRSLRAHVDRSQDASTKASAMAPGSACSQRILRFTVTAPNTPATMTQAQKEDLDRMSAPRPSGQPPDEPGDEEAVVQALIRGQSLRRLRELRCKAERAQAEGLVPEEHLQYQKIEVEERHQCDRDVGKCRHSRHSGHRRRAAGGPSMRILDPLVGPASSRGAPTPVPVDIPHPGPHVPWHRAPRCSPPSPLSPGP